MTIDWVQFTPWRSLAGGVLIGLAATLFILLNEVLHELRPNTLGHKAKMTQQGIVSENAVPLLKAIPDGHTRQKASW